VIDLAAPTRIHVIGVGGAGMSAIATVLSAMGHEVTGSDIKWSPTFARLRTAGLKVTLGHDPANVAAVAGVAVSSAIPPSNVEVIEAGRLGVSVWSRADMLTSIATLRRTIAVAGTHGKTTTSSMLALILVAAGMRPSFIIGGDLNDIGTNAVWDEGEWLVVEADESDGTFLRLRPELAVVTSVEPDHLEHYGSFSGLRRSFSEFMAAAGGCVVAADDPVAAELAPPGAITFGQSERARIRLGPISGGRSDSGFSLFEGDEEIGQFEIAMPGEHNARNAAAAAVAARAIGVRVEVTRRALARFAGVARRFEFRGEANGVVFVDDYAHLPSEARAALAAAKRGGFTRVVCVFQPHRYSRIAALAPDFAGAFADADVLFVTEIYNSGEAPRPGVTGRLIVEAVLRNDPGKRAEFVPIHSDLLARLQATLEPGDCCLILEAGDLTGLPDELRELGGF
jgi:UDP-N-acetylmuramate--alanine ligase